jgi:hypothetical protein
MNCVVGHEPIGLILFVRNKLYCTSSSWCTIPLPVLYLSCVAYWCYTYSGGFASPTYKQNGTLTDRYYTSPVRGMILTKFIDQRIHISTEIIFHWQSCTPFETSVCKLQQISLAAAQKKYSGNQRQYPSSNRSENIAMWQTSTLINDYI